MKPREKTCVSKRRYLDKADAMDGIEQAYLKYGNNAPTLKIYKCNVCKGYHLTTVLSSMDKSN